jgi:hypothetical protein
MKRTYDLYINMLFVAMQTGDMAMKKGTVQILD